MRRAGAILKAADLAPVGITQLCYFNGSRADYARAVQESIRAIDGPPVTYYFVDGFFEPSPVPDHEVVLFNRARSEVVVSIFAYCNDHFWSTQHITMAVAKFASGGCGGRQAPEKHLFPLFLRDEAAQKEREKVRGGRKPSTPPDFAAAMTSPTSAPRM